jgi:hypothetical protein
LGGAFEIATVIDQSSDALIGYPDRGATLKNPALADWHHRQLDRLPGLKVMRTLWVCDVAGGPFQFRRLDLAARTSVSRRRMAIFRSRRWSSTRSPRSSA